MTEKPDCVAPNALRHSCHPAIIIGVSRRALPLETRISSNVFDKAYFGSILTNQIKAAGNEPTVEVHLVSGQGHRVRAVIDAQDGWVVLETYQRRAELTSRQGRWVGAKETSPADGELHHVAVSYHTISQVVITPTDAHEGPRIGFSL
jgi:hypothetical protein